MRNKLMRKNAMTTKPELTDPLGPRNRITTEDPLGPRNRKLYWNYTQHLPLSECSAGVEFPDMPPCIGLYDKVLEKSRTCSRCFYFKECSNPECHGKPW